MSSLATRPAAPPGVPRTVKGLSLVSLFNDFASEMVYPLLPAFVTRNLAGGPLVLGLMDGASDLTSSVLKWVSGRLADRPKWRAPLILGGYATAVLVRPVIALAGAAWQVVGLRVLDRLGKGIRTAPRDVLIAEVTNPRLRGRAFGFHRGADHFGAVLGSLTAWWLLQQGADVRRVIGWSVVPGLVALAVLMVVLRGTRHQGPGTGDHHHLSSPAPRAWSLVPGTFSFWPPMLALSALAFFRLPETLLILRLQDRGVPVAAIPLIWGGLHIVRTFSAYPGGRLADVRGARKVVAAGGLLFAALAFALGFSVEPYAAVALFLVFGLVAGLTESGERSLVARLAPTRTGHGFGVYHGLTGIAALPAGVIFGWLYQAAGGPVALWSSAAGMLLAVAAWGLVALPSEREAI
jgi:MFS family permease